MNGRRFWGIAAIIIGSLALLERVPEISPYFASLFWNYWPLIMIAAGILVLLRAPKVLVMVLLIAALAFVIISGSDPVESWGGSGGSSQSRMARQSVEGVQALEVGLTLGAGEVEVSGNPAGLYEIEFSGEGVRSPKHTYSLSGGLARLDIQQGEHIFGQADSHWQLRFSEVIPLSLDIRGGAGYMELDFSKIALERLSLSAGAGKVKGVFGARLPETTLSFTTAASDLDLTFPKGSTVVLRTTSPLTDLHLEDGDNWSLTSGTRIYQGAKEASRFVIDLTSAAAKVRVRFS